MYLTKPNPHGGDVYGTLPLIDFSASINPMGMPEPVRRALIASAELCSAYPDPYCRALRAAISRAEGIPAENILCGAGASELIYQYALALTGPGPALIVSPAFCEYASALNTAGRGAEHHILTPERGFRLGRDILSVDLAKYSAVFICSPANPTGVTVEPELIWLIAGTGAPLFLDFSFLDLTDNPGMYSIPSLCARFPNVSVLRSPAKSFAIPGVRLGYLMSSDTSLLERISSLGQCWNVSVPAQAAGAAAMDCSDWLRGCVKTIGAERRRLRTELSALGLTVYAGEANFLLARSPAALPEPLARLGFTVRDCSGFAGLTEGYFRTAVRTRDENDRLIAAIREVLSCAPHDPS